MHQRAKVAELVDALDSKSSPAHPGCRFESDLWYDKALQVSDLQGLLVKAQCRSYAKLHLRFSFHLHIPSKKESLFSADIYG
jgi:hypothetical protein